MFYTDLVVTEQEHQGSGPPSHASYNGGCTCRLCKIAHREYRREQRARLRGVEVVPMPDDGPDAPAAPRQAGPCEVETRAELEDMPAAVSSHRAEAEAMIALAKLIDDPRFGTTRPSATAKLMAGLESIRNAKSRPAGRLYQIAQMSQRGRPTAG